MNQNLINKFRIIENPTREEMKFITAGLERYNKKFPTGNLDIPTPDVSLILRNNNGEIVGGLITSMLNGVMHFESLWIEEKYRGKGYGRDLLLIAERIGKEKEYSGTQTWTFSFQAPEFYQNVGYNLVGIFDGYTRGCVG